MNISISIQCIILICVGFSFGGLLACTVAARVWSTTYVPANILKESLACITFGQPHIPVPLLSETATLRPELASTVHSIYLKDDVVPRLSKFLNECCSSLKNPDSESSAVMKVQRQQKMVSDMHSLPSLKFMCHHSVYALHTALPRPCNVSVIQIYRRASRNCIWYRSK